MAFGNLGALAGLLGGGGLDVGSLGIPCAACQVLDFEDGDPAQDIRPAATLVLGTPVCLAHGSDILSIAGFVSPLLALPGKPERGESDGA